MVTTKSAPVNQCSKPTGWLGRFTLWRMNSSHSKLTDWGLSHIPIESHYTILDVGCGGGRTISKLAAIATQGKVYGVDYSEESVAATMKTNTQWINRGRAEVHPGSVSELSFPDNTFDLVTAVETDWPKLLHKSLDALILIAEVYKGAISAVSKLAEKHAAQTGMTLLTVNEHRELLTNAGYSNAQVIEERSKGWICSLGGKQYNSQP